MYKYKSIVSKIMFELLMPGYVWLQYHKNDYNVNNTLPIRYFSLGFHS